MRHRPDIQDTEILSSVRDLFNIELRSLEFLPVGEGAWVYKGQDQAEQNWFIKLLRDDATSVEQITAYLHDTLGLAFVLSPLPVRGSSIPKIKDYHVAVYPFVEGEVLGSADLAPYKGEIGSDLRKLHDARLPDQPKRLLPVETFDKFQDSASQLIARARSGTGSDVNLQRAAAIIERYSATVDTVLENGRLVSEYCRLHASTYELVVCHADIHPFNIMNSPHGLVMVDWDGIMLAPRERDLMFYANDMRSATDFHHAYGSEYALDECLITYYAYEWVLQEFTDYLGRLFDAGLSNEARQHALDEFEALFGEGKELGGVVKNALDSPLP